jgi:hypothetical protein
MRPVSHVSWSKIMLDALKILHAELGSCAAPCKTQILFLKSIAKNLHWEQVDRKICDWEKTIEYANNPPSHDGASLLVRV